MVKAFGWSLRDIDETDIESLFPFISRLTHEGENKTNRKFCDEVDWL